MQTEILINQYKKLAELYGVSASGSISADKFCPGIDELDKEYKDITAQINVQKPDKTILKEYKTLSAQINAAQKKRANELAQINTINDKWLNGKLSDTQRSLALQKLNPIRFDPEKTRGFKPEQNIARRPGGGELGLKAKPCQKTPDIKAHDKVRELDKKL